MELRQKGVRPRQKTGRQTQEAVHHIMKAVLFLSLLEHYTAHALPGLSGGMEVGGGSGEQSC